MSSLNNGNTLLAILSGDVFSKTANVLQMAQNEMSLGNEAPRFQSYTEESLIPDIADTTSGLMSCLFMVVLNHFWNGCPWNLYLATMADRLLVQVYRGGVLHWVLHFPRHTNRVKRFLRTFPA